MRRLTAIGLILVIAFGASPATSAEENRGSAGYMLPLCKGWLRIVSKDGAAVKNEVATGDASPGGIVMHFTIVGMCAGMVVGIAETLKTFGAMCPPEAVSNEQLVRMAVAHIERYPQHMHEDFMVSVGAMLMATWLCRKQ